MPRIDSIEIYRDVYIYICIYIYRERERFLLLYGMLAGHINHTMEHATESAGV